MPKSAATAKTPQLPELRLRWHRLWGPGEQGRRPWHPQLSSFLWATICLPASAFSSRSLHWAPREPLPLRVSPAPPPSRAPHPRMASAPAPITAQTSVDYWLTGKGGQPRRPPPRPPHRSKGTKGPEQRGWPPSQLRCPQQLLIQVLQVCLGGGEKHGHKPLITNWFREGKAGEAIYTSLLQPQVEIPALARMSPRAGTGLEVRVWHLLSFAV